MNILYQIVKLLISLFIPMAIGYFDKSMPLWAKALLSANLFLVWSSFDVIHHLRKIGGDHRGLAKLWDMEHTLELILNNIRGHYRAMMTGFYNDNDIFKDFAHRTLAEIEKQLRAAAETRELYVEDFHFQNVALLLGAFKGDSDKRLRYVWVLEANEPLFDEKWEHYFAQIDKAVRDGDIVEVQALLVLGDGIEVGHEIVQKLAGFFGSTPRQSYRVINKKTYLHIKSDNRMDEQHVDFGIYGTRYIYRTISYGKITAGKFCKEPSVIASYTRFFGTVWDSQFATVLKGSPARVDLTEVLALKWPK